VQRRIQILLLTSVLALCACSDDSSDDGTGDEDVFVPDQVPDPTADTSDAVTATTCCELNEDCNDGTFCVRPSGEAKGQCQPPLPPGECFSDHTCKAGEICSGYVICGCDEECAQPTTSGNCIEDIKPDQKCCSADKECVPGTVCVRPLDGKGTCEKKPTNDQCWSQADCDDSEICKGVNHCPCDVSCDTKATFGLCTKTRQNQCKGDRDCPGGSCKAGGECTEECPPGDPSCCDGNICIPLVNECTANDHCATNICVPGSICYDFCPPKDPSCCFGNKCGDSLACPGNNPQGCVKAGCADGEYCQPSNMCISSSCTCNSDVGEWECDQDCNGGVCVETSCPGKNPQGCKLTGCPQGQSCTAAAAGVCVPVQCSCDESTGFWSCSSDCGGGVCQ